MSIAPAQNAPQTVEAAAGFPWTVYPSSITCPDCQDGIATTSTYGGRWNSYLGGWEPDETEASCETCNAEGSLDVYRCTRCHLLDEDTPRTEQPIPKDEWCVCTEDEMDAFHGAAS